MEIAKSADIAIVFTVADSGEGYITVDTNMGDRNNLSVWNNGDNLVRSLVQRFLSKLTINRLTL